MDILDNLSYVSMYDCMIAIVTRYLILCTVSRTATSYDKSIRKFTYTTTVLYWYLR